MGDNIIWGVKWGIAFAIFFSLIGLLMVAVTGGEIIERQEVSLGLSLLVYWVGGLIGGIMLGAMRPLTRRRVGAMVCGAIIMLIVGVIAALLISGAWWDQNGLAGLIGIVIGMIIMGAAGGYLYWEPPSDG